MTALAADIETLLAEVARLTMQLEASQAALTEVMVEHSESVAVYEAGLSAAQKKAATRKIIARTQARLDGHA